MSQRVTAADTLRFTGTFEYQGPPLPPPRLWVRVDIGRESFRRWVADIRVDEDISVPESIGFVRYNLPTMDIPLRGLRLGTYCMDIAIRQDHPTPGFPDNVWNVRMTDAIEVVAEMPDANFQNLDVHFRTL